MKIVQVATGLISIPPNGWGAVERIIWMYKDRLKFIARDVDILSWDQVEKKDDQLVHCHMANTALDMRDKGIPYVYSLHDHHAEWYGNESGVYKNNLEAIKGSVFSVCHGKHIINQFPDTDKLFFLPHGVDTDFFTPPIEQPREHRLLMIANNGLAGDSTIDRKGFRYAIEAAKRLDLPITIAGPENNLKFFEGHTDLLEYNKLSLKCTNPTDAETLSLYQTHTIFVAPSFLEYGHPNLSILEALSCGLPIVGTCFAKIDGMYHLGEISTEAVVEGLLDVINNYVTYRDSQIENRSKYDWLMTCFTLNRMYKAAEAVNKTWTDKQTTEAYLAAYGV